MRRNKIVSKTLRPYIGALSVITIVGLLAVGVFDKVAPKLKKEFNISDNFVFHKRIKSACSSY